MRGDCYQVTEWMPRRGACGPTGYPNTRLNINWCEAEVERLAEKGIKAWVDTDAEDENIVAVFAEGTAQTWRARQ